MSLWHCVFDKVLTIFFINIFFSNAMQHSQEFPSTALTRFVSALNTLYTKAVTMLGWGGDLFLLVVRLYWGWQFFGTGKGKLMNLDGTIEFFTSLNIPMPAFSAFMAGNTEMIGGILLILGLGTRFTGIALSTVMIVAYCTADYEKLSMIFSDPDAFTSATPFLFLVVSLLTVFYGAGRIALDAVVERVVRRMLK